MDLQCFFTVLNRVNFRDLMKNHWAWQQQVIWVEHEGMDLCDWFGGWDWQSHALEPVGMSDIYRVEGQAPPGLRPRWRWGVIRKELLWEGIQKPQTKTLKPKSWRQEWQVRNLQMSFWTFWEQQWMGPSSTASMPPVRIIGWPCGKWKVGWQRQPRAQRFLRWTHESTRWLRKVGWMLDN